MAPSRDDDTDSRARRPDSKIDGTSNPLGLDRLAPRAIGRRESIRMMGGALGAATLAPLLPLAACAPPDMRLDRPNIVLIMADDLGYGDLGCYGASDLSTPNVDSLARSGVRFSDFYAAPACTAARIAMMTGSYAARAGDLKRTGIGSRVGIHADEITLPELLQTRGYATHLVGKWHLGMHPSFSPLNHGFDSFFGMLTSNGQSPPLVRGHEIVEPAPNQAALTEHYTEEAISLIEREKARPFFLFLSHLMPHVPLGVPADFMGRSARGLYGDAVELVDWSTGRVMRALESHGLQRQTLVIFCSDNGPWLAKGDEGGSAGPLRGGKGQLVEGGVRVPCVMRFDGQVQGDRICSEVCGLIDFLPSFAELAGAHVPDDRIIDGRNIWPLIQGAPGARSPHEHFFFFRGSDPMAVRSGRWKYYASSDDEDATGSLFDLRTDIGERTDVAFQHPHVAHELESAIRRFSSELARTRREPGRIDVATR